MCWNQRHYSAIKGPYRLGYGLTSGHIWLWMLDCKILECQRIDAFQLGCWRRPLRVSWTARTSKQSILRKSALNTQKDWCWSWASSILVFWCEQSTYWKSPWCWERLMAGEEGVRGWDDWMASLMQWTWTWENFMRWWGTGRPGVLQSMRLQRVGHNCATEQQIAMKWWDWAPWS